MNTAFPGLQPERTEKANDRFKAVDLGFVGIGFGCFSPTEAQELGHLFAKSAQHPVEDIPGIHSECLLGIKIIPKIRCAKTGNAQQALIYQGKGIGHRAALFLRYLYADAFLGAIYIGCLKPRFQFGLRIFDHQGYDSVLPYRQMFQTARMLL